MPLFLLAPDESPKLQHDLRGRHKWRLPGVRCDVCKATWGCVGAEYPAVNLGRIAGRNYLKAFPVPLDDLEKLRLPLIRLMPRKTVPLPGTEFGPLVGTISGVPGDFAWRHSWTLLIKRNAFANLIDSHVRLPRTVKPQLEGSKVSKSLVEFQVEPIVHMALDKPLSGCPACGRHDISAPRQITVLGASVPQDVDLFRIEELPTHILATERFVNVVKELGVTGCTFEEVHIKVSRVS